MNMDFGVICLLDVLGVKRIYDKISPYEFLDKMENIHLEILKAQESSRKKVNFNFDFMFISDTLFIFSKPNDITTKDKYLRGILELVLYNCHLLCLILPLGINQQIFFRGAISCAPFIRKNNFIVGHAIDEVAEEFEKTNWIGVHTTKELSELIESYKKDSQSQSTYRYIKYDIPFKSGLESRYCINWPKFILDGEPKMKNPRNFIVENLGKYSLTGVKKVDDDIKIKHENTLKFFDDCYSNYNEST